SGNGDKGDARADATSGHGNSRARQTRKRLERALVDTSQVDAERARSVTVRLERAREPLQRATGPESLASCREELEAALASAEIERSAAEGVEQKKRVDEKLAEERRKRIELQLELESLEDRHEKFLRERAALDESARTIRDRYTERTDRLYKALILNEGPLGE